MIAGSEKRVTLNYYANPYMCTWSTTKTIGHCIVKFQISDLEQLIPDQYFLDPAGFKSQIYMIP